MRVSRDEIELQMRMGEAAQIGIPNDNKPGSISFINEVSAAASVSGEIGGQQFVFDAVGIWETTGVA